MSRCRQAFCVNSQDDFTEITFKTIFWLAVSGMFIYFYNVDFELLTPNNQTLKNCSCNIPLKIMTPNPYWDYQYYPEPQIGAILALYKYEVKITNLWMSKTRESCIDSKDKGCSCKTLPTKYLPYNVWGQGLHPNNESCIPFMCYTNSSSKTLDYFNVKSSKLDITCVRVSSFTPSWYLL